MFEVDVKNVKKEREGRGPARVWSSDISQIVDCFDMFTAVAYLPYDNTLVL